MEKTVKKIKHNRTEYSMAWFWGISMSVWRKLNGREYKKIKSVIAVESVKHKSYVIIYEKFLQQVFGWSVCYHGDSLKWLNLAKNKLAAHPPPPSENSNWKRK